MKNYTQRHVVFGMGYDIKRDLTDRQREKESYIKLLSNAVRAAACGWDGVYYMVMEHNNGDEREYMVLHDGAAYERWIPIDGNNNACNLAVLGENLF